MSTKVVVPIWTNSLTNSIRYTSRRDFSWRLLILALLSTMASFEEASGRWFSWSLYMFSLLHGFAFITAKENEFTFKCNFFLETNKKIHFEGNYKNKRVHKALNPFFSASHLFFHVQSKSLDLSLCWIWPLNFLFQTGSWNLFIQ